jgi:phospholipid/cholesterol/gamma-HCH transport system substrate-binding protein
LPVRGPAPGMSRNLGPRPIHRSLTVSAASPVATSPGRHFGVTSVVRPLAGLVTVFVLGAIIALAIALFNGRFTQTVPVTVIADRTGLVMNPQAKVKMREVEVGRVASIEARNDGTAAIHLAMDPAALAMIPANVAVDISATTVFGSKYVQLMPPDGASAETLRSGQIIAAQHVTVEVNTLFQQLTEVVSAVRPEQLNTVLTALATGLGGRGQQFADTITDSEQLLAALEPSLPNLRRDLATAPTVLNAFADVTPDLMRTLANSSQLSGTVVDQQASLDRFLLSAIGIADIGNDVIGGNRVALTDVTRLLVPTTELLNEYHPALNCLLSGLVPLVKAPPLRMPGAEVSTGFTWGVERYRYPQDLPKVAATGGPQCAGLPVQFEKRVPYLVADTGANPYWYGNSRILLNTDGLKQALFGPVDGPPRNSMQIGHPG